MFLIHKAYKQIMLAESALSPYQWPVPDVRKIFATVTQISEIAKSNIVLRSYANNYNLTRDRIAYESVGAHTNLMLAMLDRALSFQYGQNFTTTSDGYTYREVMEAARRHDLPENVIGDIPDDGEREDKVKFNEELAYHDFFSRNSPDCEETFDRHVRKLLLEMEEKSSPTGKLLYIADKASAIVMVICYNENGDWPRKYRQEMILCETNYRGGYLASEMWCIDYFKMRSLVDYDETGFFTALIVMYILRTNYGWFKWREEDYGPDYIRD